MTCQRAMPRPLFCPKTLDFYSNPDYSAGKLYPIEVKKSASTRNMHFNGFDFLTNTKADIGHGEVVCLTDKLLPIGNDIDAVPVGYI